jgi:cell division protein ZapA
MSDSSQSINVKVYNRSFRLKADPQNVHSLEQSASMVHEKMEQLSKNSTTVGSDRIAILTAIQLAGEVLALTQEKKNFCNQVTERITALQERIQNHLSQLSKESV